MTYLRIFGFSAVFVGACALVGCSSDSSGCADGGDAACTSSVSDASTDAPTLFGFSMEGDSCFVVTAVAPGSVDGCMIGVADAASMTLTLPLNYVRATATVTLGKMGSLGAGPVAFNKGTLNRDGNPTLDDDASCTWHQTDTSQFELIANDSFTVGVTEVETGFSAIASCGPAFTGIADPCTSTWKWTMAKSAKTPPCL